MICKNCGHELFMEKADDDKFLCWLHANVGYGLIVKKCYVEKCKCKNPERENKGFPRAPFPNSFIVETPYIKAE